MLAQSKFHTEDPQILGDTVLNLFAIAIWRSGFVHPWSTFIDLDWGIIKHEGSVVFISQCRESLRLYYLELKGSMFNEC